MSKNGEATLPLVESALFGSSSSSSSSNSEDGIHLLAEEDVLKLQETRRTRASGRVSALPATAGAADTPTNEAVNSPPQRACETPARKVEQGSCSPLLPTAGKGAPFTPLSPRAAEPSRASSPFLAHTQKSTNVHWSSTAQPDGIPPSLARLLRQYLPSSPSSTQPVREEARQTGGKAGQEGISTPGDVNSKSDPLQTEQADEQGAWHRLLPPQWTSPTARPHTASAQAASTDNHHAVNQAQLWFLLTRYPRDASACLALSCSVSHVLNIMRQHPPPDVVFAGTEPLVDVAAGAHARHRFEKVVAPACAVSSAPTCPCGCLVGGRYVDVPLCRFHWKIYLSHLPFERVEGTAPQPGGADHVRDRASSPLVQPTHAPVEVQPLPSTSPVSAPPTPESPQLQNARLRLTSLQMELQVALMPLFAVQALAAFVWVSSEQECAQRQRRLVYRGRRSCDEADKEKKGQQQQQQPPRHSAVCPNTEGRRRSPGDSADAVLTAVGAPSPQSSMPLSTGPDFETAYTSFCGKSTRLLAAMACVRLAWSHLQRSSDTAMFVPRLEALGPSSPPPRPQLPKDRQRQNPMHQQQQQRFSDLRRAAAATGIRSSDALAHFLLKSLANANGATPSNPHVDAFHRLRVRLLAQVWDGKRVQPAHDADGDDRTEKLRGMERHVEQVLLGRTATMPLWCAVAVEMAQLYTEERQRERQLHQYVMHRGAEMSQRCSVAWACVHGLGIQQLVRLLVQLLLLPTLCSTPEVIPANSASPPHSAQAAPPRPHGVGCTHQGRPPLASVSSGWTGSSGVSNDYAPVAAATLREILPHVSQHMTRHPLFGIAAAVQCGAVPLSWAVTCVVGTCGMPAASCSRETDVRRELTRVVEDVQRWLRLAEGCL